MVIAVPTLAIEETWHGRPLIDQRHHLWIIPAVIVSAAFVAGGAFATRRPLRWQGAVLQGGVVGGIAVGILIVVDVVRRAELHAPIYPGVAHLWEGAGVGAVLLAMIGGELGRQRSPRPA